MLYTKFQPPEPNSSGEEDFLSIFLFLNPRPPAAGPFWTPGPTFEQTW